MELEEEGQCAASARYRATSEVLISFSELLMWSRLVRRSASSFATGTKSSEEREAEMPVTSLRGKPVFLWTMAKPVTPPPSRKNLSKVPSTVSNTYSARIEKRLDHVNRSSNFFPLYT